MFLMAFMAFLSQRIQVGKLWTTKVFKPKWQRFNIIKGLKQMMLSPQTILRTLKSFLFCVILGIIPTIVIMNEYENFLPMYYATPDGIAGYMLEMAMKLAIWALGPILVIAAFDVWQSRYAYKENMKMTKDEVKDERKNAEGDPVIKNKQKQKMMQVMASRMLQSVPKADVVVTNPTHLAVALRYNAQESPAPIVIAKGADHLAEKIKGLGIDLDAIDALKLAEEAGSSKAVNIVLMGRLSHYFDLPDQAWQKSLEAMVPPKFLELNKKAFALGKDA